MKHTVLATILFAVSCNVLADEPYKHQYENGGYFDDQEESVAVALESDPFKSVSENGELLNIGALPPTATGPTHILQPEVTP